MHKCQVNLVLSYPIEGEGRIKKQCVLPYKHLGRCKYELSLEELHTFGNYQRELSESSAQPCWEWQEAFWRA